MPVELCRLKPWSRTHCTAAAVWLTHGSLPWGRIAWRDNKIAAEHRMPEAPSVALVMNIE